MSGQLKLLVDGADMPEHGKLWQRLASALAGDARLELLWLDRTGLPVPEGARRIPFPGHRRGACAADSVLIQGVCDHFGVDVFASAGFSTPLSTPTLLLIDTERLALLSSSDGKHAEPQLALAQAQVCLVSSKGLIDHIEAARPGRARECAVVDWTASLASDQLQQLAAQVSELSHRLARQRRSGQLDAFFAEWDRLRRLQAAVDFR